LEEMLHAAAMPPPMHCVSDGSSTSVVPYFVEVLLSVLKRKLSPENRLGQLLFSRERPWCRLRPCVQYGSAFHPKVINLRLQSDVDRLKSVVIRTDAAVVSSSGSVLQYMTTILTFALPEKVLVVLRY
jgi:hypothetical protein